MLTACASSVNERPQPVADPVIETRTEVVRVCPPELTAARPARPVPAADAVIEGNPTGLAWLNAVLAWAGLIEDRLSDAAAQCPARN
jgi:hypothetical protein